MPDLTQEKKLWQRGWGAVAGLDEVGRGPLAGPVVAAAVVVERGLKFLSPFLRVEMIRDSKKFSPRRRKEWHAVLTAHDEIKWGIGLATEKIIDRINILEATKLAMMRALAALTIKPDYLLLDGNFLLTDLTVSQKAVVRGDEKIWSCAAASIIAKVTRDDLMEKYDAEYPQYGFKNHKGYGTKEHLAAIRKYGACPLHRLSFRSFGGRMIGALSR